MDETYDNPSLNLRHHYLHYDSLPLHHLVAPCMQSGILHKRDDPSYTFDSLSDEVFDVVRGMSWSGRKTEVDGMSERRIGERRNEKRKKWCD